MAEHLASIFGTEKDRVNCPFYFKVRRHTTSFRGEEISFLFFSNQHKVETNRSRIGTRDDDGELILILFVALSLTSLTLTLTGNNNPRRGGLFRPITTKFGCCYAFAWDQNDDNRRSARADTASDALDCTINQPSRKRFCSSTCTRYAFATRSLRYALVLTSASPLLSRSRLRFETTVSGTSAVTRRELTARRERDRAARSTGTLRRLLPRRLRRARDTRRNRGVERLR